MVRYAALAVVLVLGVLIYFAQDGTRTDLSETRRSDAVGTTGQEDSNGEIHELDTITGMNDAHELVGRRFDLHVPVQQHINDVAFWVGAKDNRLLVVMGRDTRDGTARQKGQSSTHGLDAQYEGQMATISGTVHAMPRVEDTYSWQLTEKDLDELRQVRVYLRADAVTPHFNTTTEVRP